METAEIRLNAEQKKAVTHGRGPLLIIAGAGSGKTTVVTERVRHLISAGLAAPEEILALTFTEKASREMGDRVDRIMPYGLPEMWISTFHAFCDRVLRADGIHIGIDPGYTVMTQAESVALVRSHIHELKLEYFRPLGNPTKFLTAMLTLFERLRDEDIAPDTFRTWAEKYQGSAEDKGFSRSQYLELSGAYTGVTELKIRENRFDYADLISNTLRLFRERPNILDKYRKQFKYILVDEFQDTNFAQNELAVILAHPANNITVVGDDDQAIYRFRGAAISNILDFRKRFKNVTTVVLTHNYRSTTEILNRSYRLITQNNPDRLEVAEGITKKLVSARGTNGKKVEFLFESRVEDEASRVAAEIVTLVENHEFPRYSDFVILVRANDHADPFVRALSRAGVPYQFLGPGQLFRQPEVKDLIAYLTLLTRLTDTVACYRVLSMDVIKIAPRDLSVLVSFSRESGLSLFEACERLSDTGINPQSSLPKPDISPDSLEKTVKFVAMVNRHLSRVKKDTAGQILYYFLEDTGLLSDMASYNSVREEKTAANIAKFFGKLKSYESSHDDAGIYAVADYISLSMELGESPAATDTDWTENNAVSIMTVHSAKGLEFPVVFLVNLVAERFPTRERPEKIPVPDELVKETLPVGNAHLEEERRLFYVGMTRARDRLYLTAARYYGEGKREKKISPFVLETLGEEVLSVRPPVTDANIQLALLDFRTAEVPEVKPSKITGPLSLSYSRLETFDTCPLQYKYRYVVSLPVPASASLSFGDTIHRTLLSFYEAVKSGAKPTVEDLLELFASKWSPVGYGNRAYETRMKKRGERMLTAYYKLGYDRQVVPRDLEKPFRIRMGPDLTVAGKIDRVDDLGEKLEIIDYKTGQSPKKKDPRNDRQLTMYALAASDKSLYGKKASDVLVSLYFLEDQTKVTATRTEKELSEFRSQILGTAERIREGKYPAKPGMHCDFCEFRLICEAWK